MAGMSAELAEKAWNVLTKFYSIRSLRAVTQPYVSLNATVIQNQISSQRLDPFVLPKQKNSLRGGAASLGTWRSERHRNKLDNKNPWSDSIAVVFNAAEPHWLFLQQLAVQRSQRAARAGKVSIRERSFSPGAYYASRFSYKSSKSSSKTTGAGKAKEFHEHRNVVMRSDKQPSLEES